MPELDDYENAGELPSYGIETGLKFDLDNGFYGSLNYTYQISEWRKWQRIGFANGLWNCSLPQGTVSDPFIRNKSFTNADYRGDFLTQPLVKPDNFLIECTYHKAYFRTPRIKKT